MSAPAKLQFSPFQQHLIDSSAKASQRFQEATEEYNKYIDATPSKIQSYGGAFLNLDRQTVIQELKELKARYKQFELCIRIALRCGTPEPDMQDVILAHLQIDRHYNFFQDRDLYSKSPSNEPVRLSDLSARAVPSISEHTKTQLVALRVLLKGN
ncbi:MAG: hypothetical protein JSS32_07145 [Verrucomicrobia bacterium]|nr:hypothetical protein [Verrucomicrobiota bacterium]